MAKRKVNKSAKVREYLEANPGAGPSETATALKEFGVTPALVSNIKGRMQTGRRKKRARRGRPQTANRAASRNGTPRRRSSKATPIMAAAELIRISGSLDEAKAALETAGQVASVLK